MAVVLGQKDFLRSSGERRIGGIRDGGGGGSRVLNSAHKKKKSKKDLGSIHGKCRWRTRSETRSSCALQRSKEIRPESKWRRAKRFTGHKLVRREEVKASSKG